MKVQRLLRAKPVAAERYKSGFEVKVAKELRRLKAGAKYEILKLPYTLNRHYLPDWVLPNGVILEAKGKLDTLTRQKMLAVKAAHPGLKICFIFMNARNKLYKGSKTTYGEWATKNGFEWSDKGQIQLAWLK